jgi:hypothetical protein
MDESKKKWQVKVGSVEEFFARGKTVARAADRGEPIHGDFVIACEDPDDAARLQVELGLLHKPTASE